MGLEYIVQPQIFLGGLTALGPGIQGLTENYPLLTTYYSWTSTASVDTTVFSIPIEAGSIYDGPGKEASFIVSVGGVIQSPTEYTIDTVLRTITFSSVVSAGIELAATQLATAAPSSQNFDYIRSVSAEFTDTVTMNNLSAINGVIDTLFVTNLTALSTTVNVIDIQMSEVSGFNITGDLDVQGIITTQDLVATNATVTNLTASTGNLDVELLETDNAIIAFETVTDSVITNLTATNISDVDTANITDLTVTDANIADLTITNAITVNGDISASNSVKAINLWPNRQSNLLGADSVQFGGGAFEVFTTLPTIQPNYIYEANFYVTLSARVANPIISFQLSGSSPFTIINGQAWGDLFTTAPGNPYTVVDLKATFETSEPNSTFLILPSAIYNAPINTVTGFNITVILSADNTLQLQLSGSTNQISRIKGRTLYNVNLLQGV